MKERASGTDTEAHKIARRMTRDALLERMFSHGSVVALCHNQGLERAQAEKVIRDVCDPIIEHLRE